jgi:2-dehydropantoate 2-reductase
MTHWNILGAGSLGSLWACYLKQQYSVSFITRQSTPQQTLTLSYEYPFATHSSQSFDIPSHTANSIHHKIDNLLLCTKAYDALDAIRSVSSNLHSESKILLLQNGLGSQQAIANEFPDLAIYAASCTEGAYKKELHHVVHAGLGLTQYGPLTPAAATTNLDINCQLKTKYIPDIQPILIQKLAINCAINGLTCIYNCHNGELLDQGVRQNHLLNLCKEIQISLDKLLPENICVYERACEIAKSTAKNISSMRQDIINRKPTEIKFMNGYLNTLNTHTGANMPFNLDLIEKIKQLENACS